MKYFIFHRSQISFRSGSVAIGCRQKKTAFFSLFAFNLYLYRVAVELFNETDVLPSVLQLNITFIVDYLHGESIS